MSEIFVSSSHGSLTELICRRKLWVRGYVVCVSVRLSVCEECSRTSEQKRGEVGKGLGKSQAATPVTEPHQTQNNSRCYHPMDAVKKVLAFWQRTCFPNCYPDTFPVGVKRSPSFLILLFLPLWLCRVFPVYITVC